MTYVADLSKANGMMGKLIGNGQCVTFVHATVTIPTTYAWRKGVKVRGNLFIAPGTVIAVFDAGGRYVSHMGGSSHAAIYLGQDGTGIQALDQWNDKSPQPVHERPIGFRNGHGHKVNDADQYYVVE